MVAAARKRRKPKPRFRASWRGHLRFGLVSFEVQAVNAQNKEHSDVHFHLLHAPDHQRIHYAKMCPKHGEVPNDEIVEGYEIAKGHYIEFSKEEIDALRSEREKSLTVDAFVAPEEIDPIYFDGRMYFLIPSGTDANEPYALLTAAMERKNRWGIGQVVFSGREQLALVRPIDGVLAMAMLNYEAEIRKPSEFKGGFTKAHLTSRQLKLAEELVSNWHEKKLDLGDYRDRYQEKMRKAIEAKKKGVEFEPQPEEEPEVINLMDALRRSITHARTKPNGRHSSANGKRHGRPKNRRRAS